jgi:hypothetical protein
VFNVHGRFVSHDRSLSLRFGHEKQKRGILRYT